MKIEVCPEQLNEIVVADLKDSLDNMRAELIMGRGNVWSHDPKEDRKMIKKHIKALELIIDYYGGTLDDNTHNP